MALERDLEFELGQDITIDFSLDNGSGSAETVTGWTFAFTVKKTKDGSALFTKTSSDGISVLAASTKPQIRVTIARANTSSLVPRGYYYDLARTDSGSNTVYTKGALELKWRVS
jgi:hypothetical protein